MFCCYLPELFKYTTHPGRQVPKIKKYPMFVPNSFKIKTNSIKINPKSIQSTKCIGRVPKAGRKKCATMLRTHEPSQLLASLRLRLTGSPRRPQKAPESFRRAQEAPEGPTRLQSHQDDQGKPQEVPGRALKALGGPRKLRNLAN